MLEKTPNPLPISKSVAPARRRPRPLGGGGRVWLAEPVEEEPAVAEAALDAGLGREYRLEPLIHEWLLDLQVLRRSERTIEWYRQKMDWYLSHGQAKSLAELSAFELKRYTAELQARGLAENTVTGTVRTLKAFASWAAREGYPVEPALLRVRAPKISQQELSSYTAAEQRAILAAAPPGWPRIAVEILLGTGMRVGELCALTLDDIEDDGEATFLKIRRGKGAKFRRVPVSHQLRRELVRYVNRLRPDAKSEALLLMRDGRPVSVETVSRFFQRLRRRVGLRIHAHKFRHTFATEYLRRGGEIERLRRILGHTTYVMVMRYVHLDKGDLYRDFDLRTPF